MFKSNQRNQFAPSPMDYMKGRIEQARHTLLSSHGTYSEETISVPTDGPKTNHTVLASSRDANADDEFQEELSSSQPSLEDVVSSAESLMLPIHKGDVRADRSPSCRLFLITTQPLSILLIATFVFCISSTAHQILGRFNLYQATYKFPFPLTLTCVQFMSCEVALLLWSMLSSYVVQLAPDWKGRPGIAEPLDWNFSNMKDLASVSLTYVLSCSAVMFCLEYVPLSHAAFLLSPMILLQLALTKFFHPDGSQSLYTATSCTILMAGHALTSVSPAHPGVPGYNLQGVAAGFVACIAIPLHNSLLRKTLLSAEYSPRQMLHYILISSIAIILPLILISGEVFEIAANCFFLDEKGFWLMILVLSLVGVLACFSQFLLLTITTPLTVVVLSLAKSALLQMPLTDRMNHSSGTWYKRIGMLLSIAGVCGYLYLINHHRPRFGLRWNTYSN